MCLSSLAFVRKNDPREAIDRIAKGTQSFIFSTHRVCFGQPAEEVSLAENFYDLVIILFMFFFFVYKNPAGAVLQG